MFPVLPRRARPLSASLSIEPLEDRWAMSATSLAIGTAPVVLPTVVANLPDAGAFTNVVNAAATR
jgi:hypothetical protein